MLTIRFWLKAFIPKDVYKKDGSLSSLPRPKHANQTMLPGPTPGNDCFSTDNRGFSSDPTASSRMHSELVIKFDGQQWSATQSHHCDLTREFDCEDGDLEGSAFGATKDMNFSLSPGKRFRAELKAATNNPLFSFSPDINYEGTILCYAEPNLTISLAFFGKIDAFPAFEAYAVLNRSLSKTLFQELPPRGNTPGDIFGDANRSVSGLATWLWPER